jgi:uncharacterized protein
MQQKTYERAARLHNLAARYQAEGDPKRPEKLYLQSLELKRQIFGRNHTEVALTCNNLGLYYKTIDRLADARRCYEIALAILRREFGDDTHPAIDDLTHNLAQLARKEAEAREARAAFFRESAKAASRFNAKAIVSNFKLGAGPSRIHRFGVFAGDRLPGGARIIEYTSEHISRRESARRSEGASETYLCRLDSYWNLDGSIGGSGAEYINHCCEPNVKFHRTGGRVWIHSIREIEAGEELLLDYSFPKNAPRVPCYCGSTNYRGTINLR